MLNKTLSGVVVISVLFFGLGTIALSRLPSSAGPMKAAPEIFLPGTTLSDSRKAIPEQRYVIPISPARQKATSTIKVSSDKLTKIDERSSRMPVVKRDSERLKKKIVSNSSKANARDERGSSTLRYASRQPERPGEGLVQVRDRPD